jgi:Ser/Thr protein kinase RdoA (MazF antagonist)
MLDQAPYFDLQSAERFAREHYGVDGRASVLTSERDQNFLIETPAGERIVLKIANASESVEFVTAQQEAMRHVAERIDTTPRVLSTNGGETKVEVAGVDGRRHLLWAVSWLPGRPLASAPCRSVEMLEDLGRQAGALDVALHDFDRPAIHRDFYWDLANGRAMVERYRALVTDIETQSAMDELIARFDEQTAPLLARLPRAAIHNDLNDYNGY